MFSNLSDEEQRTSTRWVGLTKTVSLASENVLSGETGQHLQTGQTCAKSVGMIMNLITVSPFIMVPLIINGHQIKWVCGKWKVVKGVVYIYSCTFSVQLFYDNTNDTLDGSKNGCRPAPNLYTVCMIG